MPNAVGKTILNNPITRVRVFRYALREQTRHGQGHRSMMESEGVDATGNQSGGTSAVYRKTWRSIQLIRKYLGQRPPEKREASEDMVWDAVSLQVLFIGEEARCLPYGTWQQFHEIALKPWVDIRVELAHHYADSILKSSWSKGPSISLVVRGPEGQRIGRETRRRDVPSKAMERLDLLLDQLKNFLSAQPSLGRTAAPQERRAEDAFVRISRSVLLIAEYLDVLRSRDKSPSESMIWDAVSLRALFVGADAKPFQSIQWRIWKECRGVIAHERCSLSPTSPIITRHLDSLELFLREQLSPADTPTTRG